MALAGLEGARCVGRRSPDDRVIGRDGELARQPTERAPQADALAVVEQEGAPPASEGRRSPRTSNWRAPPRTSALKIASR